MGKKTYMLIWVILAVTLGFHILLQDRYLNTNRSIDPSNCIYNHLEESKRYLHDDLLQRVLVLEDQDVAKRLELDKTLRNKHVFCQHLFKRSSTL